MKKVLILSFLFIGTIGSSQNQEESGEKFIELNMVRYAETQGLLIYRPKSGFGYFNGLKFGYMKNEKTELNISLMKYTSVFNDYQENYSSEGYQIGIGLNKKLFSVNRLSGHLGGEVLMQYSNYDGDLSSDTRGLIMANTFNTYEYGLASLFQVTFRISDQIAILTNTRFGRYYRIVSSTFKTSGYHYFLFDPINSLGIRVRI